MTITTLQRRAALRRRGAALALSALVALFAFVVILAGGAVAGPRDASEPARPASVAPLSAPARIEVAFVLDTTGSMSSLIEGAKRKIWSIASNIIDLRPKPEIRFALIGYRDRGDAYVTKVYDLTTDEQAIHGHLLAFKAKGGGDTPESVNQALHEAVADLSWSADPAVFRVVFLVGDAPPHMDYKDDTPYQKTLELAKKKDIVVNAVQAGAMKKTTEIWKRIASLGGGSYAQIAQGGGMVSYPSPYDARIEKINLEINQTVIPYGRQAKQRDVEEKVARSGVMSGLAVADMRGYYEKKAGAKALSAVSGGGDLVEDFANGSVEIDKLDAKMLPKKLQEMSAEDRKAYVSTQAAKRESLRAHLSDFIQMRSKFVETKRKEAEAKSAAKADSFDTKVKGMIREQVKAKGFY